MERYYRMRDDGSIEFAGNSIITGDRLVINPTHEQLMDAGWQVYEHEETLEEAKEAALAAIRDYDTSGAVNSFTIAGAQMWLDKSDRVSMSYMVGIVEAAGQQTVALWSKGDAPVCYNLPVATARQLLSALELYTKAAYDVTQQHIAAISAMTEIEEVKGYDFTAGYPDRPVFNLPADNNDNGNDNDNDNDSGQGDENL